MAKLILGAFSDRDAADGAITELEAQGVPREDFSLIAREFRGAVPTAEKAQQVRASTMAAGGTVGGLAGLTLGAIATAGMLVTGPVALLAGLGWIALTTVAGGAVGAAAGGIVGALVSLGVPEPTARQEESILNAGGILLGVEDNALSESEIRECFEAYDADHITTIEHTPVDARLAAAGASA